MDDLAGRIAARYPTRFLRIYVRSKIRVDPVYAAVFERIGEGSEPLLDIGCGIGILALYLRARGFRAPIRGVDNDGRKVAIARSVMPEATTFSVGDARATVDCGGTIVLLDLLHYFRGDEQAQILASAARSATTVIIRDAIRDGSWRYRFTYLQEVFSRVIRWLRAERLHFPTRDDVIRPFDGFDAEVAPLYGRTPFNNYLFVFRRSTAGTTKE
ncbi:MAG TPA: methyltransferase domain-containing protein [Thermoanaerobaculia bacterium]|jgi:SAM-dependent methyltransferase|nr:methyltransferase domain-containing protein [Thermoanaerobaculia bacterium]